MGKENPRAGGHAQSRPAEKMQPPDSPINHHLFSRAWMSGAIVSGTSLWLTHTSPKESHSASASTQHSAGPMLSSPHNCSQPHDS